MQGSSSLSRSPKLLLFHRLCQLKSKHKHKYMEAWFARAWLLATMAREGVSRLSGTRALTWQKFSESFPDAKGWFF